MFVLVRKIGQNTNWEKKFAMRYQLTGYERNDILRVRFLLSNDRRHLLTGR